MLVEIIVDPEFSSSGTPSLTKYSAFSVSGGVSCVKLAYWRISVKIMVISVFWFIFFSLILGLLNAVCNGALLYIGVPAGPCCYRNINSSRQFFHHQGERLKRQACIGKSVCGGCWILFGLMVIWILFMEHVSFLMKTYS